MSRRSTNHSFFNFGIPFLLTISCSGYVLHYLTGSRIKEYETRMQIKTTPDYKRREKHSEEMLKSIQERYLETIDYEMKVVERPKEDFDSENY